MHKNLLIVAVISVFSLYGAKANDNQVIPGAYRIDDYRDLIKGKTLAIVANQTSMVGETHLVDLLIKEGMNVAAIMSPEHGFRDMADAGQRIESGKDLITGLPVISLYGANRKPTRADLRGIDIVVFDLQDVGVRFYTYISTLSYVMEACAENNVKCIIFDRPNPNGFYFDGNILDPAYKSFVGMHPVPIVHGMTIGEYGNMVNGEGWLEGGIKCDLTVITCKNYNHSTYYTLPVNPSPNLANQNAIYLYPSTCFFEGTPLSLGRGTPYAFQVYGSPQLPDRGFSFTPESIAGATNPPLLGQKCYGVDLRNALNDGIVPKPQINLEWIINAYNDFPDKNNFFTRYFDTLAGGPTLRQQIQRGLSAAQIRESWKEGLEKFGKIRAKYLLYE